MNLQTEEETEEASSYKKLYSVGHEHGTLTSGQESNTWPSAQWSVYCSFHKISINYNILITHFKVKFQWLAQVSVVHV